jgi:hypothetical protein
MTSSSSSTTDFIWNSNCIFGVWRFYRFIFVAKSNLLSFGFILLCWTMMFLWWCCRAHYGDSNEPKITENGVRMQKLSIFSYCLLFLDGLFWPNLGRIIRPRIIRQKMEISGLIICPQISTTCAKSLADFGGGRNIRPELKYPATLLGDTRNVIIIISRGGGIIRSKLGPEYPAL